MDHRQPYDILSERLIAIAERGRAFIVTTGDDGFHATDFREGVRGIRVGPFLNETSAKVELALRVLDAEYEA